MSATNDRIFRYGQFERAIDPTDYAYQERVEAAIARMAQRAAAAQQMVPLNAAALREMTLAIADVFDDVFGEGASEQVLGGSTSMLASMAALQTLVDFNNAASSAVAARWAEYQAQFGPNRAQRRAAGK